MRARTTAPYGDAIAWIAANDCLTVARDGEKTHGGKYQDTIEWLKEQKSVQLVANVFRKDVTLVVMDIYQIRVAHEKIQYESRTLRLEK